MKQNKNKTKIILGVIVALLVMGIAVYFFMQKYPSANNSNLSTLGNTSNPLEYSIEINGYAFSPKTTSVSVGSTVTWTNNDPVAHTITSDSGTELSSPLIAPGTTYSHKFDTKGIFDYHCSIHSIMKGEIVVN
jgi:plastocyanin